MSFVPAVGTISFAATEAIGEPEVREARGLERRAVVPGREGFGLLLLAVGVLLFFMVFLLSMPEAQTGGGSGPLAGTPARGQNPDNPSDNPRLVTIPAQSCTVSPGASVTLADDEGETQAVFTDGQNGIEITATESQIEARGPNDRFIGEAASSFPTPNDRSFSTRGNYTVVTSTGIACAGGGAAQNQGNRAQQKQNVVPKTTPRRPLPPTGGLPLPVAVAGFALMGVGLLGFGLTVRRGQRRR